MLSLKMALRSIGANKMRAALTMLGIVIGVMALVVLVSLVSSATSSVTSEISNLGSNLLTASISDDKGAPIKLDDLQRWVDSEESIGAISPYASAKATGKHGAKNGSFTVYGITPDYFSINGSKLVMGRFLKNADVSSNSRVCVIDEDTAEELIGYVDCVGEEISLNGTKYTVVGVIESSKAITASFFSQGNIAYIPYTALIRLSTTLNTSIRSFYIGPAEGHTVDDAVQAMTGILMDRFSQDEDAFSISSQNMIEDAMGSITSVLTILLGGIAAISLIVGGIGIMNIMMVTVTERTREIGIRKAIGASRATILRQFLIEAVVLCMMGCALGIFFSWSILKVMSVIVASSPINFQMQGKVVLLSVLFCFAIGVIFGLSPANKAAKMKPIDALHYGG